MRKISLALVMYALLPFSMTVVVVPAIGILRMPPVPTDVLMYVFTFYAMTVIAAVVGVFAKPIKISGRSDGVHDISIYSLLLLSIIFMLFQAFDVIFFRRVFELGISAAWIEAAESGPRDSFQGAVILLLSGAPVLFASAVLFWHRLTRAVFFASICLLAVYFVLMFMLGTRNTAIISFVYYITAIFILMLNRLSSIKLVLFEISRHYYYLVFFSILLIILILVSLWLFAARGIAQHGDIDSALQNFLLNYPVGIHSLSGETNFEKQLSYALAFFEFYLIHPLHYFSPYFTAQDVCSGTFGAYSFYPLFRIIDFIFSSEFISFSQERLLVRGVYLTLPGSLYIDFCLGGIVVGWLLTAATVFSLLAFFSGRTSLAFSSAWLLCLFAFSPFYPLPATGNGFSLLILSLAMIGGELLKKPHK